MRRLKIRDLGFMIENDLRGVGCKLKRFCVSPFLPLLDKEDSL